MIKIKKINIEPGLEFTIDSYSESGIFLVSDVQFMYVNKTTFICLFLGMKNECIEFFNTEEETENSNISESFVLKLVAATLSSEETKQQILNK